MVLTYEQLEQLASSDVVETIDCTGGWYSTQQWLGIPIARLLDMAGVKESARSVTVEAVSGYGRRFSVSEARSYLLATHVARRPLSHGHGFPLRLVAPGHRGFDWVKWVTRLCVNETSKFWQPPLPLQ
jgi:DMSO/TMAO reductase YedYZ molybdopterin-dependent catalytic subunit